MSLSVSLITFSPGATIKSSDVNSNFAALNTSTINADQLGGIAASGFAQAANAVTTPLRLGAGHSLPGSGMVKYDIFFLLPFS